MKNSRWKPGILLGLVAVLVAGMLMMQAMFPMKHLGLIEDASGEYGVPTSLIAAMIETESGFREAVVSEKGAYGLMQVTEPTALWIAETTGWINNLPEDLKDPAVNIQYGTWYMRFLLNKYGHEDLALIAYNAGPGRVDRWLSEGTITRDDLSGIPYEETAQYHIRVKRNREIYRWMYRLDDRLEEE